MKYILFTFCTLIGFSASAQWYRVDLKLKHERFPLIEQNPRKLAHLPVISVKSCSKIKIKPYYLDPSEYQLEANEYVIMHKAEHHMRYREHDEASYSFSDLAHLYMQENRFSEAQWYLLQSTLITKQQGDNHHTIVNLMDLATIKAAIGQYELAMLDLAEAHDLAASLGLFNDVKEVEKKMLFIKQNKDLNPKSELKYANAVLDTK